MKPAQYLLAAAFIAAASTASADSRVFIVANQPVGYGVDQCLADGARCSASAARAYCRSHDFRTASAYRRLDPDEVTSAIPASTGGTCAGAACAAAYVAITCER